MALNWDDLRIFLAVAREGNLSAAARSQTVLNGLIVNMSKQGMRYGC